MSSDTILSEGVTPAISPEKISERRTIVYKTLVDQSVVKLQAEKIKSKVFVKFGLLKPKPQEVRCISIEKFYEPYLVVDAKYVMECRRKRDVTIEAERNVQEIILLGQSFIPELADDPMGSKVVKLSIEERFLNENKLYIVFDRVGNEIEAEKLPHAPSEESPQAIMEEFKEKMKKLEFPPEKEIELVKSRLIRPPSEGEQILQEFFEVSDRLVIYVPVYEVALENLKTGEIKNVANSIIKITDAYVNGNLGSLMREVEVKPESIETAFIAGYFEKGISYSVKLMSRFNAVITFEAKY